MIKINIHNAKTHLSKYLNLVKEGEEILICNYNLPIAILKQYIPQEKERKIGLLKDKIIIKDDFDDLPDEFMHILDEIYFG